MVHSERIDGACIHLDGVLLLLLAPSVAMVAHADLIHGAS